MRDKDDVGGSAPLRGVARKQLARPHGEDAGIADFAEGELLLGRGEPTAVGPVSFDAKGDLRTPRVAWFRWINGRYTEIDPATLLPPVLNTTP